jgi:hypothetical protein
MRTLLITGLILACNANANAQVISVECPKSYPPKDSALEVAPPGHKGRGLVPARNPLEDWSLFDEFNDPAPIHAGEATKVKGGTDTEVPPIRWLVCYYRGGISWWDETGADKAADKGLLKQGCLVQTRDKGKSFKLVCT